LYQNGLDPDFLLNKLFHYGFRIFAVADEDLTWKEIEGSDHNLDLILNGMGYVNLVCFKANSATTFSGVLHSGALYGGERDYLELASSLVSAGNMVHSVIPLPDYGLAIELQERGSSVSFIENAKWWVNSELNLEAMPQEIWSEYINLDLISALKKVDSDFVLSSSVVFPQGAVAASILKKPHIWWIQEFGDLDHGLKLPLNPTSLGRLIKSLSCAVVTVSHGVKNYFFQSDDDFVQVIYPQPEIDISIQFESQKNSRIRLAILGSFQKGKGHEDAIKALELLLQRGINIELAFYGDGSDQDKKRLSELVKESRVEKNVIVEKFIPTREEIYLNIDIALITSRNEAYGRVPAEATAFNIPIIYANSGGPSEYMVDGRTGLAYKPGDFRELSSKISSILENSEFAMELVTNAKTKFHELRNSGSVGFQFKRLIGPAKCISQETIHSEAIRYAHILRERDAAVLERDAAVLERDDAFLERDAAVLERDAAVLERDLVLNSKTWKMTAIYRKAKKFLVRE
jgi:glycosyltransferase involved in cell wall biosynthesis